MKINTPMGTKILCVMGTRPEVIKMAPVVSALEKIGIDAPILVTAQHRNLLDQMMATFGLESTWDLDAMQPGQSLTSLTGVLIPGLDRIYKEAKPQVILAQGDTTTVFCAALAAFYAGIPFGHVEAGLRSGDMTAPFPEEGMRCLTSVLARWHFAPTEESKTSLLREGIPESKVHVVGNTVIDSLLEMASRTSLPWPNFPPLAVDERLVLMTLHRRENFGEPIRRILNAIRSFAESHPKARILYPVHPNPNVQVPARNILAGLPNVHLTEPLDYPTMVGILQQSYLVFTDSGGLQEEAPALGKPVIVFRDVTERPEAVAVGAARLVGSDAELFLAEANRLWNDPTAYKVMAQPRFPYGNGTSGLQIAQILNHAICHLPGPR